MSFYKVLKDINGNQEMHAVTVLTGEHAGEKGLVLSGEFYGNPAAGFLFDHQNAILNSIKEGVTEIEGERVFTETIGAEKTIVICGGGHVSLPVIRIAKMIGFFVTVIEDRPEFAANAKNAGADKVICDDFEKALNGINGDKNTYFVIVTRGHKHDKRCLRAIAMKPHAYIGMIGSRKRTVLVKESLKEEEKQRN